jgi:hypothetical protein
VLGKKPARQAELSAVGPADAELEQPTDPRRAELVEQE